MDNDLSNQNENTDQTNLPPQPIQDQPSQTSYSSSSDQINPQNQPPQKSSNKIWLVIVVVVLILIIGGGIFYYFNCTKNNEQPNPSQTSQVSSKALVNINEIGCQNSDLFVLTATGGKVLIDKAGNYQNTFSTEGAQLAFVINDEETVCASAISLPKYQNKVYFDAKSTTKAMVFQSIGILTTDPVEAEQRLKMIEELKSFPAAYSYVKENLSKSDLGTLNKDPNFNTLIENCVMEMAEKIK